MVQTRRLPFSVKCGFIMVRYEAVFNHESLQLNSYLALHSPKTQGIRSKKENLGRADALKAFFWGGGTYYRLV